MFKFSLENLVTIIIVSMAIGFLIGFVLGEQWCL